MKMQVIFQGVGYEVIDVISQPGQTSIFTKDGLFTIKGVDVDGNDFLQIMQLVDKEPLTPED